ncbi:MAG: protein phosphatase CheZ [Glaciecola sp.]|jgi:chemotaxis protein CheZ
MHAAKVSLAEAKQLVAYLEQEQFAEADALVDAFSMQQSAEIFTEVGKLTRQLHDSLNTFQLDERITGLVNEDIPDAESRLTYVIEETEKAANTTMDAVEKSMPITEAIGSRIDLILPEWQKLMSREIEIGEFKTLCLDLDKLLHDASAETQTLNLLLTEVLMAQGYQDLTGQVIRRVIELVKEVQSSLVHMLKVFGEPETLTEADPQKEKIKAEGPVIDAEQRDDVVNGQDDVDDLLSSLGF